MKKKVFMGALALMFLLTVGYGVQSMDNRTVLTDLVLENIEALAGNEGTGTSHTLSCGSPGVKMCEGSCGRCNVTIKNWGNGKTATLTCSRD